MSECLCCRSRTCSYDLIHTLFTPQKCFCLTDISSVLQSSHTVVLHNIWGWGVGGWLHLQWQCGGSGGLQCLLVVQQLPGIDGAVTTSRSPECFQGVGVHISWSGLCAQAVFDTTTKFNWQQHKKWDRWTLAGPELMFLFFGGVCTVLVLYRLLCPLPENFC